MKAALCEGYGPPEVVTLRDVPEPIPRDNELLIRIRATSVTSADWRVRSLEVPGGFGVIARLMLGIARPRQPILGTELAGDVESVGKDVTRFKTGDAIFAFSGAKMGCHAQYKCMPEAGPVALKPANLTYEEAAAIAFGGTTALDFLRRAKLQRAEKVLVNGASGGVGTAAVQLAHHLGAAVTGVCSTGNVDLVRSLGAAQVIDYTREDFAENNEEYDVIVDTVGNVPFARAARSLAKRGRLLLVQATLAQMLHGAWVSMRSDRKVIFGPAAERAEDLRFLADLARAGALKPPIDRRYPFERIVEAHRYVASGRKRGNVIITLDHLDNPS